ncbi:MAG: copper oxidase, partial [Candidatus Binatia bacterium]
MIRAAAYLLVGALTAAARAEEAPAAPPHSAHATHGMHEMDAGGMVMNQNTTELPRDCPKVSQDVTIIVRAGKRHAEKLPGTMYAYDQRVWNVPACSRVTVTLVNDDHVRHQWMLHGLPRYLYPEGMFHLEVSGAGKRSGTFIVPSVAKTYL